MTTGLMIGVTVIKVMATGRGIPFLTRLLKIGMEAQSQTGRQKSAQNRNKHPHSQ